MAPPPPPPPPHDRRHDDVVAGHGAQQSFFGSARFERPRVRHARVGAAEGGQVGVDVRLVKMQGHGLCGHTRHRLHDGRPGRAQSQGVRPQAVGGVERRGDVDAHIISVQDSRRWRRHGRDCRPHRPRPRVPHRPRRQRSRLGGGWVGAVTSVAVCVDGRWHQVGPGQRPPQRAVVPPRIEKDDRPHGRKHGHVTGGVGQVGIVEGGGGGVGGARAAGGHDSCVARQTKRDRPGFVPHARQPRPGRCRPQAAQSRRRGVGADVVGARGERVAGERGRGGRGCGALHRARRSPPLFCRRSRRRLG